MAKYGGAGIELRLMSLRLKRIPSTYTISQPLRGAVLYVMEQPNMEVLMMSDYIFLYSLSQLKRDLKQCHLFDHL